MRPSYRFSADIRAFLLAVTLLLGVAVDEPHAQVLPAGPQVLTFFSDVDDTEQPYALYLPKDFDPSRSYPLVMSLHGAGSNHRLNLRRVFGKSNAEGETDVEASRYFPEWEDVEYIVAAPLARGTMGYQGIAEKDVLDVLEDVRSRFPIDENRTYLTGLSMGGGGTLWLGLTRPDLWAALAPVCPAPPPDAAVFAANALHLPVHIFQGDADPSVRPEGVRRWVRDLEALGTNVEYTEYPGVGHNSWENAYAEGQIFDWFEQSSRDPNPERVRFSSDRYKYSKAYWVTLDALTPGTVAAIDARFIDPSTIVVTTSELDGFTLSIEHHPLLNRTNTLAITIDEQTLNVHPEASVSFRREQDAWVVGRYERSQLEKRAGAEGPIKEAVSSRHVYVYGTLGDPSPGELAERRRVASTATDWELDLGWYRGRIMAFPRVVADRDLPPSDVESANLVLFGTRETNRVIAELANRLPLHFVGDESTYGLVYTYPIDDHYVLVNSGIPWWQSLSGAPVDPWFRIPLTRLNGLQDYLLFEGSTERPIVSGRFDRYWSLPPDDARALEASGAVHVTDGER